MSKSKKALSMNKPKKILPIEEIRKLSNWELKKIIRENNGYTWLHMFNRFDLEFFACWYQEEGQNNDDS